MPAVIVQRKESDMWPDTDLTEIPNGVRYTAPDENRVYTPPAEPEPFVAPQVTARSVTVDGTTLEKG
jgi:hypothetical protein